MENQSQIKITVATVTWNAAAVLQRTLDSVAEQDYPCVQHVVVDGCSSDQTLTLLRQYQERESTELEERHEIKVLSESDKGLYDAMNKAINMADGDYILFLNAGDKFHERDTLSKIADKISSSNFQISMPQASRRLSLAIGKAGATIQRKSESEAANLPAVIYGDTDIVDDEGRFLRKRHLCPPRQLTWQSFKDGMLVCHQAFFARTDIARQNLYNLRYRFSADYDWCIRVMKQGHALGLPMVNADIVVADYLDGGMTVKNHRRSLMERLRVMAAHYGWLTALAKHASFVFRAIRRKFFAT